MTVHEKFRRRRATLGISIFALAATMVLIGSLAGRPDVFFVKAIGVMIFCAVLVGNHSLSGLISLSALRETHLRRQRLRGTSPSSCPRYCSNCGLDLQSVDDET